MSLFVRGPWLCFSNVNFLLNAQRSSIYWIGPTCMRCIRNTVRTLLSHCFFCFLYLQDNTDNDHHCRHMLLFVVSFPGVSSHIALPSQPLLGISIAALNCTTNFYFLIEKPWNKASDTCARFLDISASWLIAFLAQLNPLFGPEVSNEVAGHMRKVWLKWPAPNATQRYPCE